MIRKIPDAKPATAEDETRLPLWAQRRLTKLRADLEGWQERARAACGASEPTGVEIDRLGRLANRRPPMYLPANARVSFALPDGTVFDVHLTDSWVGPSVAVEASGPQGEGLRVIPGASNMVYLQGQASR